MSDSGELYNVIYDHFAMRILFGYYAYGDALPTLPQICRHFHVTIPTVRAAFVRLKQEGYIKVEVPKGATVIYKANFSQFEENIVRYFIPREEGLRDIEKAGALLIEPLWDAGLQRWMAQDEAILRQKLKPPLSDAMPIQLELYIEMLSALNNRLILNLYWEVVRYLRITYLARSRQAQISSLEIREIQTKERLFQYIQKIHTVKDHQAIENMLHFTQKARAHYSIEPVEQIPFEWHLYRRRNHLRCSIAADIIRNIVTEQYPVGSYLPSLAHLKEQYGVSLSTVRRTIGMLVHFGIVKTHPGVGTQVCMDPESLDLSNAEIQEALWFCAESLQLFALTIRRISLFTLKSVHNEVLDALANNFAQAREKGNSYLFFEIFLSFITEHCPSAMIRNCYQKLEELLACGYPLLLLHPDRDKSNELYSEILTQAVQDLKSRDFEMISDRWGDFLKQQERLLQDYADKAGIDLNRDETI